MCSLANSPLWFCTPIICLLSHHFARAYILLVHVVYILHGSKKNTTLPSTLPACRLPSGCLAVGPTGPSWLATPVGPTPMRRRRATTTTPATTTTAAQRRRRRRRRRRRQQTDNQTDGRTDGRTNGRTAGRTDRQPDGRTDGPTDRRTDGPTDRRTDGPTDGRSFD